MVVGGGLEKKNQENQEKDQNSDSDNTNNWILQGSSLQSIHRIDELGTSKSLSLPAAHGVLKFKRLTVETQRSQVEIEAERTEILSKIEQLFIFNGNEPHEIVDQLLSFYAQQNLQLQSMQAQFESLAGQKSTNLVMLADLISQINSTFGMDIPEDPNNNNYGHGTNTTNSMTNITHAINPSLPSNSTNPDIIKILSGYPVSLDTIKRALETEELECNKLQRVMLDQISLQSGLFLKLVEVLFRYNSLLKHTMHYQQGITSILIDKQLLEFSEEFSRFICTFRLGMYAKRGVPIDKSRQVQEVYQNIPVIGPRTPVTSGTTKSKDESPQNIKQVNFVFSDAIKESYSQSQQQQSLSLIEDINRNEIDKFKEKMNFIPFSKQELDRIYRIVFANASEHFLDEWCAAIKGSFIQYYMTEEDLLKYLRKTKEIAATKGKEEQFTPEKLMAASISEIQQLSTVAFELHSKNIMTIFDRFEAFTSIIQRKIAALSQTGEEDSNRSNNNHHHLKNNQSIMQLRSLILQDQPQTAAQKIYANAVAAKRQQYLNYQGDMADPITEKKRLTLRDLKVNANENASTDDVKKLIFKMASSSRNRSNQAYRDIKQNNVFPGGARGLKQNAQQQEFNLLDPTIQMQLKQQNMTEQEFLQSERQREKKEIEFFARNRSLELQREQDLLILQQKKLAMGQGLPGQQQTKRSSHQKKNSRFYKQEDKSQHRIFSEMIEHNNLLKQLAHLERQKEHLDNRSVFMKLKQTSPKNLHDYSIACSTMFVTPRNSNNHNQTYNTNSSPSNLLTQFLPFSSSSTTSKGHGQHSQLSYRQGVFASPMMNRRNSSLKGFNSNTKRSAAAAGVSSMNSTADLVSMNTYQQQQLLEDDQQQQQQQNESLKQVLKQYSTKNGAASNRSNKNLMKIIAVESSPSMRSNSNSNKNNNNNKSNPLSIRTTKNKAMISMRGGLAESSSESQLLKLKISPVAGGMKVIESKIIPCRQQQNIGSSQTPKQTKQTNTTSEAKSNRHPMSPLSWFQYTSTSNLSNSSKNRLQFDNNSNSVLFSEKSIYPSCIVDRLREGERSYETQQQQQLYHSNIDIITDQLLL